MTYLPQKPEWAQAPQVEAHPSVGCLKATPQLAAFAAGAGTGACAGACAGTGAVVAAAVAAGAAVRWPFNSWRKPQDPPPSPDAWAVCNPSITTQNSNHASNSVNSCHLRK